ncbi:MAG: saccharopine dehydrogenase NADP-binding domain-containing protein [Gemmatimonadaceae bacterium]|nr:saccharopine dehydrogenase NADP-binding domain-containing protein [Gemmatimonadaceae bacterium]
MIVLYGANGYTGQLVIEECLARGVRPVLAGRSESSLRALGERTGLAWRVAPLDDPRSLDALLHDARVVVHCAGPFAATSRPMADACLRNRVHYLDITGEIAVFEALAARDAEARARGVMLLPGAGFDVVPSDCLAAHLKSRLPSATELALAFHGGTGVSRGTARTMAENAGGPGAVRRGGRITAVPPAWRTRAVPFADRERLTVTIPWGDVSTAFHSTGIPDIAVYVGVSPGAIRSLRLSRLVAPLLRTRWMRRKLVEAIERRPPGPSAEARARANAQLWGEVRDEFDNTASATLVTPDGYSLTAKTAVLAAQRVLAGEAIPGFQTPSRAFGADFILQVPGCVRTDR